MTNIKLNNEWLQLNGKYKCPYCEKEYVKKGICSHIWMVHDNDGILWSKNIKHKGWPKEGWNTGLTKETDERIRINSEHVSKTFKNKIKNGTYKPYILNKKQRKEASIRMSLNNPGGKCKWYNVNGIKVQGTWEKTLAELLVKYDIKWTKPTTKTHIFKYIMEGKTKHYTPDFYLKDYNKYIELKGYWWGKDKEKMKIVIDTYPNTDIKIIEKNDYNNILHIQNKEELLNIINK
jgi:hypothetical protein